MNATDATADDTKVAVAVATQLLEGEGRGGGSSMTANAVSRQDAACFSLYSQLLGWWGWKNRGAAAEL